MWSFRKERRVLVPCCSTERLARAAQFQASASTSKCTGPILERGLGITARFRLAGSAWNVRDGEIKTEQADDRADQPLGLAQRQAKDGTQGQRGHDRQRRVVG